jgi:hypothetical protein
LSFCVLRTQATPVHATLACMKSLMPAICAALVLMCLSTCKAKKSQPMQPAIWETGRQESNSVFFNIKPEVSPDGIALLDATYSAEGKVAKFKIEISRGKQSGSGTPGDFNLVDGDGAFIAEPGSDPSVMVADLKKALGATKLPLKVKRVDRLGFTYVILGQNQTRGSDGGFNGDTPGNWTAMKIFMPTTDPDEDDCEVFLNLNTQSGQAEFSMKDVLFGNEVLAKLATVL